MDIHPEWTEVSASASASYPRLKLSSRFISDLIRRRVRHVKAAIAIRTRMVIGARRVCVQSRNASHTSCGPPPVLVLTLNAKATGTAKGSATSPIVLRRKFARALRKLLCRKACGVDVLSVRVI